MKRLFIAVDIELSDEFRALSQKLKHDLRNDDILWVNSHLHHLTLRFLGETPETKIEPLVKIISTLTSSTQAFELQLDKIGVFGSKYKPEVLWYGFSEFHLFKALFENLEKELIKLEFQSSYGNFVPHITVGRIKKIDRKKSFWEIIESSQPSFYQAIQVKNLKLIQSKLTNDGPIYKTLFDFILN